MKRLEVLKNIKERFGPDIVSVFEHSDKRLYLEIKPAALTKIATFIFKDLGARFNIASGVDRREQIEILYHFTLEEIDLIISLRVKLDKTKPEIESLTPLMKAVDWIEREIHEMFGVNFRGHPNLKKLLLPDEWPDGVYPLRRDYQEWDKTAKRDRGV
jgi:NADH-quinone oxidoreductase subunit C